MSDSFKPRFIPLSERDRQRREARGSRSTNWLAIAGFSLSAVVFVSSALSARAELRSQLLEEVGTAIDLENKIQEKTRKMHDAHIRDLERMGLAPDELARAEERMATPNDVDAGNATAMNRLTGLESSLESFWTLFYATPTLQLMRYKLSRVQQSEKDSIDWMTGFDEENRQFQAEQDKIEAASTEKAPSPGKCDRSPRANSSRAKKSSSD